MAVFDCTMESDPKTMRQNAKHVARQLRLIAKELDRRGVQVIGCTLRCELEHGPLRATPELHPGAGIMSVAMELSYTRPARRVKAEGKSAG